MQNIFILKQMQIILNIKFTLLFETKRHQRHFKVSYSRASGYTLKLGVWGRGEETLHAQSNTVGAAALMGSSEFF